MSTKLYGPLRAGRAFRESDSSNSVVATATQGDITITENEDGLIHFNWNNRLTQTTDVDLIVFPSDATFTKVAQSPGGRMHVLKFSSSDQRYFFWLQDNLTHTHETHVANVNGLLQDPEYQIQTVPSAPATSSSTTAPTTSTGAGPSGGPNLTAEQLEAFRSLVSGLPQQQALSGLPEYALSDILSPTALAPLFETASPETLRTIFPTLPSDLTIPPSAEALRRVVGSPQFQAQVRALDRALRTGLVGSLVVGLGLPEEAGLGLGPFLAAIQEQAKKKREGGTGTGGDSMETD